MSFISRKIKFTTRILLTDLLISLVVCNRPRKIAREFIRYSCYVLCKQLLQQYRKTSVFQNKSCRIQFKKQTLNYANAKLHYGTYLTSSNTVWKCLFCYTHSIYNVVNCYLRSLQSTTFILCVYYICSIVLYFLHISFSVF